MTKPTDHRHYNRLANSLSFSPLLHSIMLHIRPVVLQRIERADRHASTLNSLSSMCHGNVLHTCPIERASCRKIASDADELMNQYSAARAAAGGGDQLIIDTDCVTKGRLRGGAWVVGVA